MILRHAVQVFRDERHRGRAGSALRKEADESSCP